jgi:pimeloyl-ACP methyl ester carboxylesterase
MVVSNIAYTTGSILSADGTSISYRQLGRGPGIVLVHGSLMAAQNFMKLAGALSDSFTVYIPNRRGRAPSGAFGGDYGLHKEVEDIDALLRATESRFVFGLSSGAIISLQSALELPRIQKLALYEPPLTFDESSSIAWAPQYERELARGNLAGAFLSILKGTGDSAALRLVPDVVLRPLIGLALKLQAKDLREGDVSLRDLVPTMHYDLYTVRQTQGALDSFRRVQCPVLLLGGSRSAPYLKYALDRLETVLLQTRRVELPRVGHLAAENGGKPAMVAAALRRFFS